MKKITAITLCAILIILPIAAFFDIPLALASTLELKPNLAEITVNSEVEFTLNIEAADQSINAIEGTIFWPQEFFEYLSLNTSRSLINLWVEAPQVSLANANGALSFAGIITNGYQGSSAEIISFKLKALKPAQNQTIAVTDLRVFLNDGSGTLDQSAVVPFTLSINQNPAPTRTEEPPPDLEPPENFQPQIIADTLLNTGQKTLIFSTEDKQSGIAYYQVKEGDSEFEEAKSPYLIKNPNSNSALTVRAVDYQGNIREVTVNPQKQSFPWIYILPAGLILLGFFITRRFNPLHKSPKHFNEA